MLHPGGPSSHFWRYSGFVWHSKMRSGGASNVRVTRISRSDGVETSRLEGMIVRPPLCVVTLLQFVCQQDVEPPIRALPLGAISFDPSRGVRDRLCLHA